MITKLTEEQQAKFPQYVAEWTAKGLTTKQLKLEDAEADFEVFQRLVLKKDKPAPVSLFQSPKACWDRVNEVLGRKKDDQLKFVYPYFDCQFWASWFAFYEYCANELDVVYKNRAEYDALRNCQKYGMVFPLDQECIVCQPMSIVKKNASGLNCEDGPALSYSGDNEIFALNGVMLKKEYVLTPAEKLDTNTVLKETNVEVRRELIRKVGMDRVISALPHKLLDKRDTYELYSIELSEELKDARYLKMTNPSIGCFHLEGVAPEIKTVAEALKWRNQNLFENADILT